MSDAQTTASVSRTPSLAELLEKSFEYQARKINVALPGKVVSYDAAKQIAEVEPMVKELYPTATGREVLEDLPVLPNVPVVFPRGGGHFITFPIAAGDFVLLVFNQRSIDRWYRGNGDAKNPDDFRTHDLSDAVAIPGFYPYDQPVGEADIDSNLVMGKDGGSTIHIREDGIISLSESDATDFVARADRVEANLDAINAWISAVDTIMAGAPINEPGNGSPSALQAAFGIALSAVSTPSTTSTATDKVKAT